MEANYCKICDYCEGFEDDCLLCGFWGDDCSNIEDCDDRVIT